MRLKGRTIGIPVAHDLELLYPLLRFAEEGASATIAPCEASFSARQFQADHRTCWQCGAARAW